MEKLAKLHENLTELANQYTKVEIKNPVQLLDNDTDTRSPRISSKGVNLQDLHQIPNFEDAEEAEFVLKPNGITKRQWNFVNKFVEQIKKPRIEGKNHSQNLFYAVTETMPDLIDTYLLDLEGTKMEHFIDKAREKVLAYLNDHKNTLASKDFFIDPVKAHEDSLADESATLDEVHAANKMDAAKAIESAEHLAAPDVEDINEKLKYELAAMKRANSSLEKQVAKEQRTAENRLNASRRANDRVKQKLRDKIQTPEEVESSQDEHDFYEDVAEAEQDAEKSAQYKTENARLEKKPTRKALEKSESENPLLKEAVGKSTDLLKGKNDADPSKKSTPEDMDNLLAKQKLKETAGVQGDAVEYLSLDIPAELLVEEDVTGKWYEAFNALLKSQGGVELNSRKSLKSKVPAALDELVGAIEDYDKLIELKPDIASNYWFRAGLKEKLGDLSGAIEDYDKAVELRPDFASNYWCRARLKEESGDLSGAIEDYDKAIELEPDDASNYRWRAGLKDKLGDLAGAMEDWDKVIELKPADTSNYWCRARLKETLGDLSGANKDRDKARE